MTRALSCSMTTKSCAAAFESIIEAEEDLENVSW